MERVHLAASSTLAALAVAVVLAAGQAAPQGAAVPADVQAAAQTGLKTFLGVDAGKGLDRLGLRTAADVASATIGDGFQVHLVDPDRLLGTADSDFDHVATPITQWQFLVVTGKGAAAMLTVDRVNGQWTAVSLGASGLASQIQSLMARWPRAEYRLRLFRSHQAASDVMEVARAGKVLGAVPFQSGRVGLGAAGGFDPNDLWTVDRVVTRMRPVVRGALGRR